MKNKLSIIICICSITGVILQFISSTLDNSTFPMTSAISIFRYFTIQTNVIVGLYFLIYLFAKKSKKLQLQKHFGGVVIYITMTFLGYVIFLEKLWNPVGLALVGNILNHYIVPLSTIAFLVIFRKDFSFKFIDTKKWIVYPIVYLIFLVINGMITSDYLYPFL
ncbi:MAG: Pr6Pr family membrane protein, partial [Tenericutes bacterium]|nr:Pr6Pr family membrane protein [Mycoplasmatota bacterium]